MPRCVQWSTLSHRLTANKIVVKYRQRLRLALSFMKAIFDLIWRHKRFFLLATAAGLALRLFFVFRLPVVAGDSFIYGDIAKNWLNHGIYGLTDNGVVRPTLIRL